MTIPLCEPSISDLHSQNGNLEMGLLRTLVERLWQCLEKMKTFALVSGIPSWMVSAQGSERAVIIVHDGGW